MAEWVLPPRRPADRQFPQAEKAGTWRSFDSYTPLHGLADDLSADATVRSGQELLSVPDAWGHIDTFRMALGDEAHALHQNAVREWRALLALFALGHRYKDDRAPLKTLEVPLNHHGDRDRSFGQVLNRLLPSGRLAEDMDWGGPILILLGRRPVGLLSPTTLVAPARDGLHTVTTQRPWLRGGTWQDPATAAGMVKADLACLSAFLTDLREQVLGLHESPLRKVLLPQLKSYIDDVSAALQAHGATGLVNDAKPRTLNLETGGAALFGALKKAYEITVAREADCHSELILPPRRGLPEWFKGGVLMDPDVARALGRDATSILCWNGETLARVTGDNETLKRYARDAAADGYLPLTLDDLFTPTLAVFEDGSRCEGHPAGLEGCLLPLTPLALLFLDPDTLRTALSVPRGDGEHVVELTVTVQASDGQPAAQCTLRRAYGNDRIRRKLPPQAFLWPNFSTEAWTHYYTYRSFEPELRYSATKPLDRNELESLLGALRTAASEQGRAFVEGVIRTRLAAGDEDGTNQAIARTTKAPEALACGDGAAGEAYSGLLLLKARTSIEQNTRKATIGVDFGTTNTCVCCLSTSDGRSRLLTLKADRVWWPYRGPIDEIATDSYLPFYFLPAHAVDMPFRTLLYRKGNPRQPKPVRDVRIAFPGNVLTAIKQLKEEGENNFLLDIKWADQDRALAMNMFMSQIVIMAMAELVADGVALQRVKVRFSYPEAFTQDQVNAFTGALQTAMDSVGMADAFQGVLYPESLAASWYFQRTRNIIANQPFITLDVGGHTSDVAIWSAAEKLLWKGSLEIGGRDLLVRFLAHNRAFFADLLDDDEVRTILMSAENADQVLTGPLYSNVIETIVNSPDFTRALTERGPALDATAEMATLKSLTILTFSGILHYLGCVARRLTQEGQLDQGVRNVTLCLGGRGSLLFRTVFENNPDRQTALKTRFRKAADLDEAVRIPFEYGDSSKEEVAAGLAQAPENANAIRPALTDIPLGELIHANTVYQGPWTGLEGLIESGDLSPKTELEAFRAFLKDATQSHGINLTNLNEAMDDIALRVEGDLAERLTRVANEREPGDEGHGDVPGDAGALMPLRPTDLMSVQPPFILALRRFAHALAKGSVGANLR